MTQKTIKWLILVGFIMITGVLGFIFTKWYFAISGTALFFYLLGRYWNKKLNFKLY